MPGRRPEDRELQRMNTTLDRLFFRRYIAGLKSMPLMMRLLLASPDPADAHSRPFGPLQEHTSMERYLTYWKRFLCYCMRAVDLDKATLLEQHSLRLTDAQRAGLEQLRDHLEDSDWPEDKLEEELLQLSAGFWMQQLEDEPFQSPVWHFVGVLNIDSDNS